MKCLGLLIGMTALTVTAQDAGRVTVESVEWRGLERGQVKLLVRVRAEAKDNITLRRMSFEGMSLEGFPFFLPPVKNPVQLGPGSGSQTLPLDVTIYLRDWRSLECLRRMVSQGNARLRGRARLDVDLQPWQMLLLWTRSVPVLVPLERDIPVEIPGGEWGRKAAEMAISTMVGAAKARAGLLAGRVEDNAWAETVRKDMAHAIYLAETRYTVDWNNGRAEERRRSGIAFSPTEGRVLLPGELLEPWRYDTLLQAGKDWKLRNGSVSLELRRGGEPIRQYKVRKCGGENESVLLLMRDGTHRKADLALRASAKNVAVLEAAGVGPALTFGKLDGAETQRLLVFRFPAGGGAPEAIVVHGRREGERIVLDDEIDEMAFGSPIVSAAGVVGMLQDEHTGLRLPAPSLYN